MKTRVFCSWEVSFFCLLTFLRRVELASIEKCDDTFVNFLESHAISWECDHDLGYKFNDGGIQKVNVTFHHSHYALTLHEPKTFPIEDIAGCDDLSDVGNRVHKIAIFIPPSFDDVTGCGIKIDGEYLFGAILLDTKGDNEKPVDTGRIMFPVQKNDVISELSLATASAIASADDSTIFIDVKELHKLEEVNASKEAYAYLYYDTVVKMFLDLPITITKEVVPKLVLLGENKKSRTASSRPYWYETLKGDETPVPVDPGHCDFVYRMVSFGTKVWVTKLEAAIGCVLSLLLTKSIFIG